MAKQSNTHKSLSSFRTMNKHPGKRRDKSPLIFSPLNACHQNQSQTPVTHTFPTPTTPTRQIQVTLLHSTNYTRIVHQTMNEIHQDRDLLLSSLLYYSGFIKQTPSFFHVVKPKIASRYHLESFHDGDYLDIIECCCDDDNNDNDACTKEERNYGMDCSDCNKTNIVSNEKIGINHDDNLNLDDNHFEDYMR